MIGGLIGLQIRMDQKYPHGIDELQRNFSQAFDRFLENRPDPEHGMPSLWSDADVLQALTEGGVSTEGLCIFLKKEDQAIRVRDPHPLIPKQDEWVVITGSRVFIKDGDGDTLFDHFYDPRPWNEEYWPKH